MKNNIKSICRNKAVFFRKYGFYDFNKFAILNI